MFSNQQIPTKDIPSFKDVTFKPIPRVYLKAMLINKILIYTILFGILLIVSYSVKSKRVDLYFPIIFPALGLIASADIVISVLGFSKRAYAIRTKDIMYKQGLIVHKLTIVPYRRIQHTDVSRSFIARKFKLANLNIYTAGEAGDDLSIKGLAHVEAQKLSSYLVEKINEHV